MILAQGVDHELKRSCEDLIALSAKAATQHLRAFVERCTEHRASSEKGGGSLASQDFAAPARVDEIHAAFRETCFQELHAVSSKMRLYLADEKAVGVLLAPVQAKVAEDYSAFRDLLRVEYEPQQIAFAEGNELLLTADLWAWLRRCCEVDSTK